MTREYRTNPKQRAASARYYRKNRRQHIEQCRARYWAMKERGKAFGPEKITVEEARNRAAILFGTVAAEAAS